MDTTEPTHVFRMRYAFDPLFLLNAAASRETRIDLPYSEYKWNARFHDNERAAIGFNGLLLELLGNPALSIRLLELNPVGNENIRIGCYTSWNGNLPDRVQVGAE